jgi:hypothetical protein
MCPGNLQNLDTAALVITLANIALQFLAMVWLLLQTVKLAHVKALVRVPGKAARGMTRLIRSGSMGQRSQGKPSYWGKFQPALQPALTLGTSGNKRTVLSGWCLCRLVSLELESTMLSHDTTPEREGFFAYSHTP